MADEQKVTRDEFNLNNNHQNGRPFNDIDQQDTDYSTADEDEDVSNEETEIDGKTERFYERAFAESKRMNSSISENQEIQAKLHEELGSAIFDEWFQEHSQEILFSVPNNCLEVQDSYHASKELIGRADA